MARILMGLGLDGVIIVSELTVTAECLSQPVKRVVSKLLAVLFVESVGDITDIVHWVIVIAPLHDRALNIGESVVLIVNQTANGAVAVGELLDRAERLIVDDEMDAPKPASIAPN